MSYLGVNKPALAGLALLGLVASLACAGGVELSVLNGSGTDLDSVSVTVTGREYDLGSLASGETRTIRLVPEGESHVEITHAGRATPLLVDVYLEPGSVGDLRVELSSDTLAVRHSDIR